MAALVLSSSAASLINLADSTSALAEMILLSANLLSFAALDSESCNSLLSWISLMKISSIYVIAILHRLPTQKQNDQLAFQYHQQSLVFFQANPVRRIVHMYF